MTRNLFELQFCSTIFHSQKSRGQLEITDLSISNKKIELILLLRSICYNLYYLKITYFGFIFLYLMIHPFLIHLFNWEPHALFLFIFLK